MANKIIKVKNTGKGSLAVDTVHGSFLIGSGATSGNLEVNDDQLTRISAVTTASVVAGLDADTATPFLGLPKEGDLNVNVFDQGKLNAAFDRVDTFASLLAAAASGDMLLDIDPAEDDDLVVPEADFSRVVTVRLVDSEDRIHTWYNAALSGVVTTSSTTVGGAVAIEPAAPAFVNGECAITVNCTGTWLADEFSLLTIGNQTILGHTVTGGTSKQTIITEPAEG